MALPKRWEPYTAVGEKIEGTRFISFKVPLNDQLCRKLPEELRFTPDNLVEILKKRGQKLAVVIDLTNTYRYYNKQELLKHDIQHVKILVEGKRIPSSKIVNSFNAAVEKILKETENEESLIGVHCTHGVNRTGYLICRYMVEKMSIDPDKAIEAFSAARGYPIERENFLEDLRLRRDGGGGLPESNQSDPEYNNGGFKERFNGRERSFHERNRNFEDWEREYRYEERESNRFGERERFYERERFQERERFHEHERYHESERGFHPRSSQGHSSEDFTIDRDYSGSWGGRWGHNRESHRGAYSYSFSEHRQTSPYKRPHDQRRRFGQYQKERSFQYQTQRRNDRGNYY